MKNRINFEMSQTAQSQFIRAPNNNVNRRASLDGFIGTQRSGTGGKLLNSVKEKLQRRMESSAWIVDEEEESFLPRNSLLEILTEEMVRDLLWESWETFLIKPRDITGDVKRIEILATLLLIPGGIKHIDIFIKKGICDNDLPISRKVLRSYFALEYSLSVPDSFFLCQYSIHVPTWKFLPYRIDFLKYDWRQVLPFTEKTKFSRGGQGTVWKVRIHNDHYSSKACTVSIDH